MNDSDHDLRERAKLGDVAGIEAALAQGARLEAADPDTGHTALLCAAQAGQPRAFKRLVELGANVNVPVPGKTGPDGNVLKMILSQTDALSPASMAIMETALQAGADANVPVKGKSLLHIAAERRSQPAVELLLRHGADPMARSRRGIPLHLAFMPYGLGLDLVFTLARATPDLNVLDAQSRSPLHVAFELGKEAGICCLLALGASSDSMSERDRQGLPKPAQKHLKWLARSPLQCAVATKATPVLAEVLARHDHFEPADLRAALRIAHQRKLAQMENMIRSRAAQQHARQALQSWEVTP